MASKSLNFIFLSHLVITQLILAQDFSDFNKQRIPERRRQERLINNRRFIIRADRPAKPAAEGRAARGDKASPAAASKKFWSFLQWQYIFLETC
jgi:hypothetical protein